VSTILAAPDKFRGSASAREVAAGVAAAADAVGWSCVQLPLADGGEGTLDAFGGANRSTTVTGPLGGRVDAEWRLGDDGVAVVESALASGLVLAGGAEGNDPVRATSRGTGQLVAAAIAGGARRVIVSLGGSATTDGGLATVEELDAYAPFDGLEDRYRQRYVIDLSALDGSGAAGGLGGALAALGARLVPGFELVAEHTGLAEAVRGADAVITGEGRLDAQSFNGKVVGGVVDLAARYGVPALVLAGLVDEDVAGRVESVSLIARFGPEASWRDPVGCVTQAAEQWLRGR
jgi:glycerate 2-kinase